MSNNESTTKFKADISELKAQMQEAARQVKLANSEFKAATAGMDNWSKSADGLSAKTKQLNTVLDAQKKQLDSLEKQYELTVKEQGENSKGAEELAIKINNQKARVAETEKQLETYKNELKKVESGADEAGDAAEDLAKDIDKVDSAADSVSDGFSVMKGALASLVADGIRLTISALKDLAKETLNVGMSFEAGMSQVQAVSGASGKELDALTEKAKEMGAKTKFSASESAQAFNYMAMAGWKTEDMLDGIEGIMNLAAASGEDLATTSDIVTDALTAMGYSAKDAGHLADVMAAASSNANTNVAMMGETFKYAASVAGSYGYSMEDVAISIGLMANAGIKSTQAGTSLRSIMTRLATDAGASSKQLGALGVLTKELGVQFYDAEGNMRPFNDVLNEARVAWRGLTKEQAANYAEQIAGKNALSGWLALMDAGEADVNKLTKAVKESSGAAKNMADIMNDNVSGQMTLFKSQVEGIMIDLYEKVQPQLRKGIKKISEQLAEVNWDKVGESLGKFAKKVMDLMVYVIKNGDKVKTTIKTIAVTLGTLWALDKYAKFIGGINKVIVLMSDWRRAVDLLKASQLGLNAAQLASPVGLAVTGIAALAAGVIYASKQYEKQIEKEYGLSKAQKETIASAKALGDAYEQMDASRGETNQNISAEYGYLTKLKNEYNTLIDSNGKVKSGYEDRANFIVNQLATALGMEVEEVQKVIDQNGKLTDSIDKIILKKQAEALLDANESNYQEAIEKQTEALKTYQDAISTVEEAETKRTEVLTKMRQYEEEHPASPPPPAIIDAVSKANETYDKATEALQKAETAYVGYNQTISNYEGLAEASISGDVEKIYTATMKLQNNFIIAANGTKEILEKQVEDAKTNYDALQKAIENKTPGIVQANVDQAKQLYEMTKNELAKAKFTAAESGETAGLKFASGISSKSSDAKEAGGLLARSAWEGADSHRDKAEQSGSFFGQGFNNGLNSWTGIIRESAFKLAQKAWNGLKKGQKEGSPSKLTYQSGVYFTQGYINGIASQEKYLVKGVTKLATLAIKELAKMSNYNFSEVGTLASQTIADNISSQTSYLLSKIQYQNEEKLKEFDTEIDRLGKERDAKTDALQTQYDATEDKNIRNSIKSQQDTIKKQYETLINTQQEYKSAYQTASSQMISEFTSAINSYQTQVQSLINDTINGITDKYTEKYDALITKQNTLAEKLKSAGSLFEISGAGVMTINDLTEQTKAITNYTSKLQDIKRLVSADLFDEIASYDIEEGSAFMDRLLEMSPSDLKAYDKAYTDKLVAVQKTSKRMYKGDFAQMRKDYKREVASAFDGIDKELTELGKQAMKGFVNGLTKNTDYMTTAVKTYIKGMVDTFKKELDIHSPSKVTEQLGIYTGQGFADGLKDMIGYVKSSAKSLTDITGVELSDVKYALSNPNYSGYGIGVSGDTNTSVVNNYNLVQNNTSPKSLSALETYQARRRQIDLIKAVT